MATGTNKSLGNRLTDQAIQAFVPRLVRAIYEKAPDGAKAALEKHDLSMLMNFLPVGLEPIMGKIIGTVLPDGGLKEFLLSHGEEIQDEVFRVLGDISKEAAGGARATGAPATVATATAARAAAPRVNPLGPSFAELAGRMPDEARKLDDLIAGITRTPGSDGVEVVTTRTDIEMWRRKALAKALDECNTPNEVKYLATSSSFEQLEFKVLTLREHRIRGSLDQFLRIVPGTLAALSAFDHQLADEGKKYADEVERKLNLRRSLRAYAESKGVTLREVLAAVAAVRPDGRDLHELTAAEIDVVAGEKQKDAKVTKLRTYAAAKRLTLEAVQDEIGKVNGFMPSLDELNTTHVDSVAQYASHRRIKQKRSRTSRLGSWLVNLIIPQPEPNKGSRLGNWLRL